jgi:hypothetical protein
MTTPIAHSPRPPGLLVAELLPGHLYLDRLSGYPVLVIEERHRGPDPADIRNTTEHITKHGWYWNPVFGAHLRMELKDHQLIRAG